MHERMLSRRRRDERGFTLPDMLGAMTLAIIAGTGAVTFIRAQSLALRVQGGVATDEGLGDLTPVSIDMYT